MKLYERQKIHNSQNEPWSTGEFLLLCHQDSAHKPLCIHSFIHSTDIYWKILSDRHVFGRPCVEKQKQDQSPPRPYNMNTQRKEIMRKISFTMWYSNCQSNIGWQGNSPHRYLIQPWNHECQEKLDLRSHHSWINITKPPPSPTNYISFIVWCNVKVSFLLKILLLTLIQLQPQIKETFRNEPLPTATIICSKFPWGFPCGPGDENPPVNAGDVGSIPGLGRSHVPWTAKSVPQLLSLCLRARELQLLRPTHPTACARSQEKPLQREACEPQLESKTRVAPSHLNYRKPEGSNPDPLQPKLKR